ncbi:peptide/nickel transport system permease protein [Deinococcus metalli]|uniref:Peptide ABC transporter permease n=1 Tax=Deinococcus metalli TaxID=1141878 RepID=A0A7W8KE85_9DEIO|nr:ABC transporter permease [Deinococcus metalli]MBB5376569.1 peptide/nickel transport system permease protein [Deinococcus metalli]GHF43069.1 peptide ABC transporter permease [Deinococcus metalli]
MTAAATVQPRSPARRAAQVFFRTPSGVAGLVLVLLVVVAALFAPHLAPYDPVQYRPIDRMQGPSAQHWLGTDLYGRDLFSRVVYGSRISLAVSILSVSLALLVGGTLGALAGFYLKWVDTLIMRVTDVLLAFPAILLAIALLAFLGGGFWNLTIAIAVAYVAPFARVARAAVLRTRDTMFVEASTALGASDLRLLLRHVLPNATGPILVEVTLRLAYAILGEAALSFLGLGTQPPAPAWGQMIADGRPFLETNPWISIAPGLAIMITVLGFNLLGDALRDALDPRLGR